MTSAPSVLSTCCGAMTLPSDFDILRPCSSTVKPCVSTALYGERAYIAELVSSDDMNQPRCWSEPSRYMSATGAWPSFIASGAWVANAHWCTTPESNQTSSVSV